MNPRFPELLAQRLNGRLSSPPGESRFQPQPQLWPYYESPPPGARAAAVLVLLYQHEGQWHLPLTLRPAHMVDHAGQVSLPGGAIEPGEGSSHAAVREFREELGTDDCEIELIGQLSPLYVQGSNFRITPWVGVADCRPRMSPNPDEVEELLEIPLAHLLDPANFGSHRREYQGQPYDAPHFLWGSHRIWGATCMILGELITVMGDGEFS